MGIEDVQLEQNDGLSAIIGLAVLWDEVVGPRIISETPTKVLKDSIDICTQIYMASITIFGTEKKMSRVETTLPIVSISPNHVVRVAFDAWRDPVVRGTERPCFIALIMEKSISDKVDDFLNTAMRGFIKDFKVFKENYDLSPALKILNSYLKSREGFSVHRRGVISKKSQYRIAVAGLKLAGKTSTLQRLIKGTFFETTGPTLGFDTEIIEHSNIEFHVTDLGGHDVFIHTLWRSFLPQADVLIYVVDACDLATLKKSRDVLHMAISWNPKVPILMILANKQDIPGALDIGEILERFNIPSIIADTTISSFRFFATSAKTGEGIEKAFNWLATQLTNQVDVPLVNIQSIYVFKKSGHPVMAGHSPVAKLAQINITSVKENITMLSGVYSAIEAFIKQFFNGQVSTVEVKDPSGEKISRLVAFEREGVYCLLVSDTSDDMKAIEAIADQLLEYVTRQVRNQKQIEETKIRNLLSPFLAKNTKKVSQSKNQEEISTVKTESKSVLETDREIDRVDVQKEDEGTYFFAKLSVMDRIRKIEEKR
ncbi:MAG: ADP-ribosylation factor-like protein [Candidatus Hodarchaeales archaeon]|jgi:small GTP-binding protein